MKKLIYISLIFSFMLAFASCEKEDFSGDRYHSDDIWNECGNQRGPGDEVYDENGDLIVDPDDDEDFDKDETIVDPDDDEDFDKDETIVDPDDDEDFDEEEDKGK